MHIRDMSKICSAIACLVALSAGCAIPTAEGSGTKETASESVDQASSAQNIFGQTTTIVATTSSWGASISGSGFSPHSTAKIYAWYPGATTWDIKDVQTTASYFPPCKMGRCPPAFTGGTFNNVLGAACGTPGTATFYGYDPGSGSWTSPVTATINWCPPR